MTTYRSWHNLDDPSIFRAAFKFIADSGALMEGTYRIAEDSVAGSRCLVIYKGEKPIVTIWPDDEVIYRVQDYSWEMAQELVNVAAAVKELGGSFAQLQGALVTYFKQKGEAD
jgi:hypothetical protein